MTDKETLFSYRFQQSEETLSEAKKMLEDSFSPRSIINRSYYSMFYALLALFLKTGINTKTSKHIGVISLFDKEFVKTGKIDKHYSTILHETFDARQEGDYKEFIELSLEDASHFVKLAEEFLEGIRNIVTK
ncbi:MAG: HEPN domain-containing protein [Thermodesulfovibrionales bacterium]